MIKFGKFHGFGNDYIVFENKNLTSIESLAEFSKRVCRRTTGIGGDGIAVLQKLDNQEADYDCRIINPDGSEAGFSGNGTRCAVAYLYYHNFWKETGLRLQTASGIKNYQLLNRENDTFWFLAELGKPKFSSQEIPFLNDGENVVDFQVEVNQRALKLTALNVGNPVAVVFVDDFDFNWRADGKVLENHQLFPERTNVVFTKIRDKENVEIRIWERGAGETSSSGTCSVAAAVASAFTEKTLRKVAVWAEGGMTEVNWREDGEMLIKGRADLAFIGEI